MLDSNDLFRTICDGISDRTMQSIPQDKRTKALKAVILVVMTIERPTGSKDDGSDDGDNGNCDEEDINCILGLTSNTQLQHLRADWARLWQLGIGFGRLLHQETGENRASTPQSSFPAGSLCSHIRNCLPPHIYSCSMEHALYANDICHKSVEEFFTKSSDQMP